MFLNVTTPRALAPPRPVMVFIHGGGFTGGQGAPYDPGRVVAHGDLIVVTLNYRLGALGFLAHPGLGNDPASGNFGLADQQEALRWVRRNIAAFGGDPGNVTLWGESAGGFSVCAQLAAPGARGLFQKAIIQSAPCANPLLDRSSAERRGISTAAEVGCLSPDPARTVDCLRAKPIESLAGRYDEQVYQQVHRDLAQVPWLPVVGTATLPSNPLDALRADRAADVPTLLGGTRDEMRQQVAQAYDQLGHPITAEQYPRVLEALFGAAADAVVAAYPAAAYPSPGVALATALTDEGRFVGACSQRPLIAAVRAPVFSYEFAEPVDEVIGTIPLGADHGADVPYFFDSLLPGAPRPSRTAAQDGLARRLIGYWTSFAASGVPGSDWVPATGGRVLQLDGTAARPIDIGAAHRCDLWDRMRPP